MHLIAVSNPKGGSGKSSTSTNLCAAAALAGTRTLFIDLDPQGSASRLLCGVECNSDDQSASAIFRDKPTLLSELAVNTPHGFDVIPAGAGLIQAEDWIARNTLGENRLRSLIRRDTALKARYDLIVFDTVGYKGRLLSSALIAATDVLIPTDPSELTIDEVGPLIRICEQLSAVRKELGDAAINVLGMFFYKVQTKTRMARRSLAEAGEVSEEGLLHLLKTFAPFSVQFEEAVRARTPIVLYAPESEIAKSYHALVREVLGVKANTLEKVPA